MTVRRVLAIVFAVVVAAMMVRGWLISRALDRIHEQAHAATQRGARDAEAIAAAMTLTMNLQAGVSGYALTGDPEFRLPYDRARRERESVLASVSQRLNTSLSGRELAAQLSHELHEWDREIAEPLLLVTPRPVPTDAARTLHRDGARRMASIRALLDRARHVTETEQRVQLEALESQRRRVANNFASGLLAYLCVLVIAWTATARLIERPLTELATYAVTNGGSRSPPQISGVREIAHLRDALDEMATRLEARRALLDTTIGAVAEAVVVFDAQQVCILANPAARALVGYDLVGKEARALSALLSSTPVDGPAPERVSSVGVLLRIRDASGREKTLSVNVTVLPDDASVVSARDVTPEYELRERLASLNEELQAQNEELVAQEEELRAQSDELTARNQALLDASRAKTQFLATMSHELRTPLNAVIGFSEILLDGTYGAISERQATALHHVHDAGRHLLTLIDDLLDLSKVEAGQVALTMAPVEVSGCINDAMTLVASSAEKKQIRLDVRIRPELCIRADRARVRQVALNLLSNAIKFTPDGGTVTVVAERTGDRVRIAVRDTGIGIREDDAKKLFKPFSQIESGDRRRYGGTGLGLAISKHLVELMDGDIGYASEPGVGSTFWFELPVVTRASGSSGTLPRATTKPPAVPPRVLVVEDSATDATTLEASLAQAGYDVRVAHDAELALQALATFRPALVIVDLALPGMSGLAFIEQLRAHPRHVSLPIVVLTGRDLDGDDRVQLESRVQFIARKGIPSRAEFLAQIGAIVPPADIRRNKPLVLVVDDNDVNRNVACAMVEALGFEAVEAADGATGIRLARERRPSAVLMDIEMPVMNGLEATRALRDQPETDKIPVIALTAHAMAGDADRFLAAGCNDYVSKPFSRAALRAALTRALGLPDG